MTFGGLKPKEKSSIWSQKSPFIFCTLYYCLISDVIQDLIKNVDILALIKTDHLVIVRHLLRVEETKKGPGSWKMNRSLLSDEKFIQLQKKKQIWKYVKKKGKNFQI